MYTAGTCGTCKHYCDCSTGNVIATDLKGSYICSSVAKLERIAGYTHNLAGNVPSGKVCPPPFSLLHQHASILCNNNGTHVQYHDIVAVHMYNYACVKMALSDEIFRP